MNVQHPREHHSNTGGEQHNNTGGQGMTSGGEQHSNTGGQHNTTGNADDYSAYNDFFDTSSSGTGYYNYDEYMI